MANKRRVHVQAKVSLPIPLHEKLVAMTDQRGMSMDELLSELVMLGEMSIRQERLRAEGGARRGDPFDFT